MEMVRLVVKIVTILQLTGCTSVASRCAIHGTDDDLRHHGNNGVCRNNYCGLYSYSYMLKLYKGLFPSSGDISTLDGLNNAVLTAPLAKKDYAGAIAREASNNRAMCCATYVQHIANTSMVNIYGEPKNVVHLSDAEPPSMQYIPHATCVLPGGCAGICVLQSHVITLLVLDENQGLVFDMFEIPGYCTCLT